MNATFHAPGGMIGTNGATTIRDVDKNTISISSNPDNRHIGTNVTSPNSQQHMSLQAGYNRASKMQ